MNKLSIDQVDLAGKTVLIRVDFNVPIKNGKVTDTTRIEAASKTIKYAIQKGAKVILASHLGRPNGEVNAKYSLSQIVDTVSDVLGRQVNFCEDCIGKKAVTAVNATKANGVLLLENLRFHIEETDNDAGFSEKLASLADVFVNDAFGTAHRAHASTEGVTKFMDTAVAGFLMKEELDHFTAAMKSPERPLAIVLGGAKVSSKLSVVENLLDKCEILIIGGAMSFTFLKALGFDVGKNLVEGDMVNKVMGIMAAIRKQKIKFYLPVDFVVGDSVDTQHTEAFTRQDLPADKIAGDIGPASVKLFDLALKGAKTVVWNGPMGIFENSVFSDGTFTIAKSMASLDALTVVGGGDSISAVNKAGLAGKMSFMSTGGGAFLELMEGKNLPGVAALTDTPVGATK